MVNVDEEDQALISALRAKYSDQELLALFAPSEIFPRVLNPQLTIEDRWSGSSFGTRCTTPSTQRTNSSLDHRSSINTSLRSSMTSCNSLEFMPPAKSMAAYPDWQNESHLEASLLQSNESDEFTAMDLTTLDPDDMAASSRQNVQTSTSAPTAPFGSCVYPGHDKVMITRKGDWVRHMDKYHKPGPFAWRCKDSECGHIFETEDLFRQHHNTAHRCRKCTHADDCRIAISPKRAFACGFEGCLSLFKSWTPWRDHVKKHIANGSYGTSVGPWEYSTELRNLLRREEIAALWDAYCLQQLGAQHGYIQTFHWEPETSAHLKRELEYGDVHDQAPELAIRIFRAAVGLRSSSITSNHNMNHIPTTNNNNSFSQFLSEEAWQEPGSLEVAERDATSGAPAFGFANPQDGNASWADTAHMHTSTSHFNLVSQSWLNETQTEDLSSFVEPFPVVQEPLKMYFPNGLPQDPTAAYGFPEDATAMHMVSGRTTNSQHSRTKSTSSTSMKTKLGRVFRKPGHSRSGSDNSDDRTLATQMNV